jgi:hypothetical protein
MMSFRSALGATAALLVLTAGLSAAESPAVAAIHNEIKTLRAQEKAAVHAIHVQFETMIKRDKVTEIVLERERKALHIQEEELVAAAPTKAEKEAIAAHYNELRAMLTGEIHLDANLIARLKKMEHAMVERVEATYHAKIKQLEAQAHALATAKGPTTTSGKGGKKPPQ